MFGVLGSAGMSGVASEVGSWRLRLRDTAAGGAPHTLWPAGSVPIRAAGLLVPRAAAGSWGRFKCQIWFREMAPPDGSL